MCILITNLQRGKHENLNLNIFIIERSYIMIIQKHAIALALLLSAVPTTSYSAYPSHLIDQNQTTKKATTGYHDEIQKILETGNKISESLENALQQTMQDPELEQTLQDLQQKTVAVDEIVTTADLGVKIGTLGTGALITGIWSYYDGWHGAAYGGITSLGLYLGTMYLYRKKFAQELQRAAIEKIFNMKINKKIGSAQLDQVIPKILRKEFQRKVQQQCLNYINRTELTELCTQLAQEVSAIPCKELEKQDLLELLPVVQLVEALDTIIAAKEKNTPLSEIIEQVNNSLSELLVANESVMAKLSKEMQGN